MKFRIYIAGAMTGEPELNFPLFHATAARLRALGHTVINPAELVTDQAMPWIECMVTDIAHLMTCEAIALLPGWESSKGARIEHAIAVNRGMHVFLADAL